MPIPNDLTPHGPNSDEDQMAADMRARGISEKDVQDTLNAKRTQGPDFELRLAPSKVPTDLTTAGPAGPKNPYAGTGGDKLYSMLRKLITGSGDIPPQSRPTPAWLQSLEGTSQTARNLAPSATTAATMAVPGIGVAPAVARTLTSAVGHGAEAGLEGNDPLKAGLVAGALQGGTEAIAPVARPILKFLGDLPVLGGQTRQLRQVANAVNRMNSNPATAAPAVPGEYMGRFLPTGIQKGAPLVTGGVAPANVAPVVIPHKTLPGWTAGDILNQVEKAPGKGNVWSAPTAPDALLRLLGIRVGTSAANRHYGADEDQP